MSLDKILYVIGWITAGLFAAMITFGVRDENRRVQVCTDKIVLLVGGCDRYANCKVVFADETVGMAKYPVHGLPSPYCITHINAAWPLEAQPDRLGTVKGEI